MPAWPCTSAMTAGGSPRPASTEESPRGGRVRRLGLAHGRPAPDGVLVALAALSLLAEVASEQPLLCCVDVAQWLDGASGQILGFVARRLLAESVAIVFAVRDSSDERDLAGLPELRLEGLDEED